MELNKENQMHLIKVITLIKKTEDDSWKKELEEVFSKMEDDTPLRKDFRLIAYKKKLEDRVEPVNNCFDFIPLKRAIYSGNLILTNNAGFYRPGRKGTNVFTCNHNVRFQGN